MEGYSALAGMVGKRLGELHVALASPTDDPAFSPEPASAEQVKAWVDGTQTMLAGALDLLAPRIEQMSDPETSALAQSLIDRRAALVEVVDKLVRPTRARCAPAFMATSIWARCWSHRATRF